MYIIDFYLILLMIQSNLLISKNGQLSFVFGMHEKCVRACVHVCVRVRVCGVMWCGVYTASTQCRRLVSFSCGVIVRQLERNLEYRPLFQPFIQL